MWIVHLWNVQRPRHCRITSSVLCLQATSHPPGADQDVMVFQSGKCLRLTHVERRHCIALQNSNAINTTLDAARTLMEDLFLSGLRSSGERPLFLTADALM